MYRKKSGDGTETSRQRALVMRAGVTAATGSDRNETNTERGSSERGRKRKGIITETEAAQREQRLRRAGELRFVVT